MAPPDAVTPRDRIVDFRRVPACDLRPNPKNWRTHPTAQRDALRGVLAEIGMADVLLVRELPGGALELIDGHLRAEELGAAEVAVIVLDVNESEADKLLVTFDPLAAMAGSDAERLDALLRTVDTGDEAVQRMMAATADAAGLYQGEGEAPEPPDSSYSEQYGVIVVCENEAAQEQTFNALRDEGYNCRVVTT